ncbi:MAG: hypothetical protein KDC79_02280 [Cyclobacteriaceae bacterium]|nr:hypothetical protein [Cyclobacteriaceae bacterium]
MIVFNDNRGLRNNIGYKELAKNYLEHYGSFVEKEFVVNMILMLDVWENQRGLKFERLMPSDWNMLLKATRVLSVDQLTVE